MAPFASDPLGDVEVESLVLGGVDLPMPLPSAPGGELVVPLVPGTDVVLLELDPMLLDCEWVSLLVEGDVFPIVESVALLPECESLMLDEPDILGDVVVLLPVELEDAPLPTD